MNRAAIDRIAAAVLYEGYALYPYRRTSVKNRQRWTFGCVYPPAWSASAGASEPSVVRTDCLLRAEPGAEVDVIARFLHLCERDAAGADAGFDVWHEGREREVEVRAVPLRSLVERVHEATFEFPAGVDAGRRHVGLRGCVSLRAEALGDGLYLVALELANQADLPDDGALPDAQHARHARRNAALLRALASAHAMLGARNGRWVSVQNPPPDGAAHAARCRHEGLWPVLVGGDAESETLLATPIILSDDPRVAPESPGDLFDATEIDEILTLRILTLTDEEKGQMRALDPRTCALLERTEALTPGQLLALHGAVRERERGELSAGFAPGERVRLRPRARADVIDLALAGKAATIASMERDAEGRVYAAVTIDEDPGRDLGADGQPGHRFFYYEDELERLP